MGFIVRHRHGRWSA